MVRGPADLAERVEAAGGRLSPDPSPAFALSSRRARWSNCCSQPPVPSTCATLW